VLISILSVFCCSSAQLELHIAIMQFLTVASTLLAAALAAPAPQDPPKNLENINIDNFFARRNPDVQSVSFTLSGDNTTKAECEVSIEKLPHPITSCTGDAGAHGYRFGMTKVSDNGAVYDLTIYHATSTWGGKWGEGKFMWRVQTLRCKS
jgi:hypothetical protein